MKRLYHKLGLEIPIAIFKNNCIIDTDKFPSPYPLIRSLGKLTSKDFTH